MKKIFTPQTQFPDYLSGNTIRPTSQLRIKKFLFFIFILLLMGFYSMAQVDTNSKWTWMSGDNIVNQPGVYGTEGITTQGNKPGSRQYSVSWTDLEGNFWMMGGAVFEVGLWRNLNDLWKYNSKTNQWTWINGDNKTDQPSVYGIQGIASKNNIPGARMGAISWADNDGKFWLMGGVSTGFASEGGGVLNDLWKYDPVSNVWIWVKGDKIGHRPGIYGTKGISHKDNNPGGRYGSVSWIDNQGKLWLMGGYGYAISDQQQGALNDLWKYDPVTNEWTWISGDKSLDHSGYYGKKGIPTAKSKPGSRFKPISWKDKDGNFWLMGGSGFASGKQGNLNDLWKFDPAIHLWTWVNGDNTVNQAGIYGTKGISDTSNKPGGRNGSVNWTGPDGNLWLMGGTANYIDGLPFRYNDLWKYDIAHNEWTWINGDSSFNESSIFGARGVPAAGNKPGARSGSISWTGTNGKLWLMSGMAHEVNGAGDLLNDLWNYDTKINIWTWMKGDTISNKPGVFGIQGITESGSKPGARNDAITWTASDGTMWLMGGMLPIGIDGQNLLNDLWKYNPITNEWTWVNGDNILNQYGSYGIQGISSKYNKPGARYRAVSWTDQEGKFWLMGGEGYCSNSIGRLNDLWKYDPEINEWTWIKGDDATNKLGVYGIKGESSPGNNPGGRIQAISWTDNNGKLWMMGGVGYSTLGSGYLNDLWKYDPMNNEWTWVKGDNIPYILGVYGTQGIGDPNNKPGARMGAANWTDQNGKMWLMGGGGNGISGFGSLNDLWKYDPEKNIWTWIKGDNTVDHPGIYGTKGISAISNNPGGRSGSACWIDKDGKFWLMGGIGILTNNTTGWLNDLWKYDPLTNEWTWVKGDNSPNQFGIYGTQGTPSVNNKPGARVGSISWIHPDGNLWLMGGYGFASIGGGGLNDLWKLTATINTYYKDSDGDGYGNPDISKMANYVPSGYILKSGDCNDNNSAINPGATEICDGVDNDCDGVIDEVCPPAFFVNDIIVREGNNGYKEAVFTVCLKGKSANTVSLHYITFEGTAITPEDYMSDSGTITFAPNSLIQTITVKVRGDKVKEQTEKFWLFFSNAVNVIILDYYASCTIIDDEKDPRIKIHDAKAEENNQLVKIKVSLNQESPQVVKVLYDTRDKSARSPADYTGICNGQLVFLPGETEKYIQVVIKKDNINEKTEEFEVVLKDAVNANLDYGNDNKRVAEVKIINSSPSGYDCYGITGNFAEIIEQPLILQVKVLPNPSQANFQLNISSNGREAIQLRVTDLQGRLMDARKLEGKAQQIKLGDNWRNGTYILEVIQGDERKTIQLVKLR